MPLRYSSSRRSAFPQSPCRLHWSTRLFLVVAYVLLLRGSIRLALAGLWKDVSPAVISCAAIAAVAYAVSLGLQSAAVPVIPYLIAVSGAGAIAYFVALRAWFPASLSALRRLAGHLLPSRPRAGLTRRPAAARV